ncbi:hypothetical protein AA0112_g7111 [Alternaria arborescens]|nr:hypothetical protein AA0112_g7111 [Alternaria arborescens]
MHFNFSTIAVVLAAMSVAVEAAPKGGRGRARVKQGAKDHAGDVAGGIATGAGFIPSTAGKHVMHNCCINSGGWTYNPDAVELTKKVCKNFTSAQWYNNACTEAAGSEPISGDSFYSACKAAKPDGGDNVGAGYRATC